MKLMEWLPTAKKKVGVQSALFTELQPEEQAIVDVLKEKGKLDIDSLCFAVGMMPHKASTVLLTTLPVEPHSLALEMVAVVLGAAGIGARLLGPSTPVQQILGAARALHVRAVGLTITSVSSLRAAKSGAAKLAAGLGPGVELWLGGDAADRVATAVPRATVLSSWERIEHAAARL